MAMGRNLVLVLFAIATMIHGSTAQTRHVVGDATGWTIPSGGAQTYINWAANNTFKVGDTLVFNFATGQHDVVKVTKSAYDACNGGSPLLSITTGPATVTLNETGEQYYICTFGTHCSLGQKLAINVSRASSTTPSPAPQPSTSGSPPKASPVPTPSQAPATTPTQAPATTPTQAPAATPTSPNPSTVPTPASGPSSNPSPPSTNPSSPSPTSALTPPPQDSAASSLPIFGAFTTLLSVFAVFFY